MSGGPNITICMIVFVVLLITFPFAYLKEKQRSLRWKRMTKAAKEAAKTK